MSCDIDEQTATALHEAADGGHIVCMRFLLSCGFAVDTKTTHGYTAPGGGTG